MQITTVAALLSLAATGLAAPTASRAGEGAAALGLRASDITAPSEAAAAPEVVDFDLEDGEDEDEEEVEEEEEENNEDFLSGTTPAVEKRKFNGGWCGIHMKIVDGDYHQADVTVKDASGNIIRSRHKKVAKSKNLHFKFNKGLPGKDPLEVQIGGVVDSLVSLFPLPLLLLPSFLFSGMDSELTTALGPRPVQGPGLQHGLRQHAERQLQGGQVGHPLDLQGPLRRQPGLRLLLLKDGLGRFLGAGGLFFPASGKGKASSRFPLREGVDCTYWPQRHFPRTYHTTSPRYPLRILPLIQSAPIRRYRHGFGLQLHCPYITT